MESVVGADRNLTLGQFSSGSLVEWLKAGDGPRDLAVPPQDAFAVVDRLESGDARRHRVNEIRAENFRNAGRRAAVF